MTQSVQIVRAFFPRYLGLFELMRIADLHDQSPTVRKAGETTEWGRALSKGQKKRYLLALYLCLTVSLVKFNSLHSYGFTIVPGTVLVVKYNAL